MRFFSLLKPVWKNNTSYLWFFFPPFCLLCISLKIWAVGSGWSQLRGRLILSPPPPAAQTQTQTGPWDPRVKDPHPPQVSLLPPATILPSPPGLSGPLQKSCSIFPREGSPNGPQLCKCSRCQWAKILFSFSISEPRPGKITKALHLCIFNFPTFSAVFLLS